MALRAQTVCISSHGQTLSNSLLQGWPRAHGPGKGWRRAQGDPAGTRQSLPAEAATEDWCYYKKQNSLIPAGHQVLPWLLYGTAELSCGGMHLLLRNSPESLCFIQSLMRDYPGSVISQLGESTPTPCVQCRDTDEWMIQASVISHQRNPVLNMVEKCLQSSQGCRNFKESALSKKHSQPKSSPSTSNESFQPFPHELAAELIPLPTTPVARVLSNAIPLQGTLNHPLSFLPSFSSNGPCLKTNPYSPGQ